MGRGAESAPNQPLYRVVENDYSKKLVYLFGEGFHRATTGDSFSSAASRHGFCASASIFILATNVFLVASGTSMSFCRAIASNTRRMSVGLATDPPRLANYAKHCNYFIVFDGVGNTRLMHRKTPLLLSPLLLPTADTKFWSGEGIHDCEDV